MAEPFSETARVARSISEPLTKAERETLATAAATAAADATRKAGRGESMQTSAARSAEEAVRQSAQVRSWRLRCRASLTTDAFPTRLAPKKARRRHPARHPARRARRRRSTWRAIRPMPRALTTSATKRRKLHGCVPCMVAAHYGARGSPSPLLACRFAGLAPLVRRAAAPRPADQAHRLAARVRTRVSN